MRAASVLVVLAIGCGGNEPPRAPIHANDAGPGVAIGGDAATSDATAALPSCLGDAQPLVLGANLPFVAVAVGVEKSVGSFLLDFATTASTIDLGAFSPAPAATGCDSAKLGQRCTFAELDFFGRWGSVQLVTANHSGAFGGVREAGILGTDFLSVHAFTLDYPGKRVLRAKQGAFCGEAELSSFRVLSSAGFYASDTSKLAPLSTVVAGASAGRTVPNVPTVPVRIGGVDAVAQLDTGFADSLVRFSVNVNSAYYDAIVARSPALLVRDAARDLVLTTCVAGVSEPVEAYTLASGTELQLVGTTGVARAFPNAVVFVKRTPASARSCGGIGTWTAPAAQLAASFFVDLGVVVFDPFGARVLLR